MGQRDAGTHVAALLSSLATCHGPQRWIFSKGNASPTRTWEAIEVLPFDWWGRCLRLLYKELVYQLEDNKTANGSATANINKDSVAFDAV